MIFRIIKRILSHPFSKRQPIKALLRFFKWQLGARLLGYPVLFPLTNKTILIVKLGMTGATGNIYNGLDEFNDMGFILHYLRTEDCFVDVGANIGSYTILASAHVGSRSIAIEPSTDAFEYLQQNILINNIDNNVIRLNVGVGSESGIASFTVGKDTTNRIALDDESNTEKIELITLDEILMKNNLIPEVVKIDVEGFEEQVLLGAKETLSSSKCNVVIIEDVDHGTRYGAESQTIHSHLIDNGFDKYLYDPFNRSLQLKNEKYGQNTIFIRDLEKAKKRLKSAEVVCIHGLRF